MTKLMQRYAVACLIVLGTSLGLPVVAVPIQEELNLGVVSYPPANRLTKDEPVSTHHWTELTLKPSKHQLGYLLTSDEQRLIFKRIDAFARSFSLKNRSDDGRFLWQPSQACLDAARVRRVKIEWCFYSQFASISEASLTPVVNRLIEYIKFKKLNSMQAVALIVSYVQEIPYKSETDKPFGVLAPSLVTYLREGDCDSKALLAHMLISAIGVKSVMLTSAAHNHAILGVALPAQGYSRIYKGTRYALVEMTAKLPIGQLPSSLFTPDDWNVIAVYSSKG